MYVTNNTEYTHSLTSATSFWNTSAIGVLPKVKGPALCGMASSHCSRRGIDTLNGRFPTIRTPGISADYNTGSNKEVEKFKGNNSFNRLPHN